MNKIVTGIVIAAAGIFAAGCSHNEPKPEPAPVQPPPTAQPAPAPMPPQTQPTPPPTTQQQPMGTSNGAPIHGGGAMGNAGSTMPKGAKVSEQQATQTALQFAQTHGLANAYIRQAEFKNGAWVIALHGPGPQPNTENKMSVVVDNNGMVRSHALIPYGSPGWGQAK